MNIEKVLLSLFLILISPQLAHSFEVATDEQFFVPRERSFLENPGLYNGEYYSDIRTFSRRIEDDWRWRARDRVYMGSLGSLNGTRFQTEQRLKYRKQVSPRTHFGFSYIQQQDLYYVSENAFVEAGHKIGQTWTPSIVGTVKSDKKELDIGLRSRWDLSSNVFYQMTFFAPEFSHNKRNEENDRFKKKPLSLSVQRTYLGEKQSFSFYSRYEWPLSWLFPDTGESFSMQRWVTGLQHHIHLHQARSLDWRIEYNDKTESQLNLAISPIYQSWRSQRYQGEIAFSQPLARGLRPHRWGARFVHIRWRNQNRDSLQQSTFLPFFEYEFFPNQDERRDSYAIEYEQAWHLDRDEKALIFQQGSHLKLDQRLNIRCNFRWSDRTRLSLMFTADIDRFGSGATWEGGGGQLEMDL